MTSKEAFKELKENAQEICEWELVRLNIIEKDLEVLECFKEIDKKELKDFIETQIKYTLNENSWLSTCNADLEKEKLTQHLIKIKEWLEHE